MKHLLLDFRSPCGGYLLTFEDDCKVAYAYLKDKEGIIGDVWLYNRCATPEQPEWKDRKKIPFANCKGYMSEEGKVEMPVRSSDVNVDWDYDDDKPIAYVYLFKDLYGVVGVGDKPGFSRFAIKDGPLGKVLEIDEEK